MHLERQGVGACALQFLYDTGAETPMIYEDDLPLLGLPADAHDALVPIALAGGLIIWRSALRLIMTNCNNMGSVLRPTRSKAQLVTVMPGRCDPTINAYRLESNVTRATMYTGSKPAGSTLFGTHKSNITSYMSNNNL